MSTFFEIILLLFGWLIVSVLIFYVASKDEAQMRGYPLKTKKYKNIMSDLCNGLNAFEDKREIYKIYKKVLKAEKREIDKILYNRVKDYYIKEIDGDCENKRFKIDEEIDKINKVIKELKKEREKEYKRKGDE